MTDVLRIANCSGFYGDRLSAAREMVHGGPIDVLCGDWLAELTMAILVRDRAKDETRGYARTFVAQMKEVLEPCLERGIKVVSNAGGLNPAACADAVREVARELGLDVGVAHVAGDDLMPRQDELGAAGATLTNLDTGEELGDVGYHLLSANAYLGGWGVTEALVGGADVVVTGRVADASLVSGAAAWRFGWGREDLDALAGAIAAGHVIECGAHATGGNFAFFREVEGMERVGFPIAEIAADGTSTITKHEGTGGAVTVDTVTAQLLYEIGPPAYRTPDVVARFDAMTLTQEAPDRVRIAGVTGEPAPETTKVAANCLAGHRNGMTVLITGLDVEEKAALVERTLWAAIPGGREAFDRVQTRLVRADREDPRTNEEAVAYLDIQVQDADADVVGRAFSSKVVEIGLATIPGFTMTAPPGGSTPFAVYWPALVPSTLIASEVVAADGTTTSVPALTDGQATTPTLDRAPVVPDPTAGIGAPRGHGPGGGTGAGRTGERAAAGEGGPTADAATDRDDGDDGHVRIALGRVFGTRSGDKGGDANVGVWAREDAGWAWLRDELTEDRLRELLPEAADLRIERHELANLRAINVVIRGLLGRGVSSSLRLDPQAKGLGEYLGAKVVALPEPVVTAARERADAARAAATRARGRGSS